MSKIKPSYKIAFLLAAGAVLWVLSGVPESKDVPPAPETKQAAVPQVQVRMIAPESVTDDVLITGRAFASRRVTLRAETEGRVEELVVDKGAAVTAGQVLVRLEERDRRSRVAEAQARLKQREAEYTAAKALETRGFNSKIRLAQATADREQAAADLRRTETDLAHTAIAAPFEGIVFDQAVEIGDYVSVGSPIFSIVALNPLDIRGYVTERQVATLHPGGPGRAAFPDGIVLEGAVTYIAPSADPATRTYEIELTAPNPDGAIADGMTAQMHLFTAEKKAWRISPAVLSLDDDGRVGVKIVEQDNTVRFVPVNILADRPDSMLVTGLPDQARVITVGQDFVVPGQTVEPVPAETEDAL